MTLGLVKWWLEKVVELAGRGECAGVANREEASIPAGTSRLPRKHESKPCVSVAQPARRRTDRPPKTMLVTSIRGPASHFRGRMEIDRLTLRHITHSRPTLSSPNRVSRLSHYLFCTPVLGRHHPFWSIPRPPMRGENAQCPSPHSTSGLIGSS